MSRSAELFTEHAIELFQKLDWLDVRIEIFKEDQRKLLGLKYPQYYDTWITLIIRYDT